MWLGPLLKIVYRLVMKAYFFIPAFDAFISGGNLYNEHLIQALEKKMDCMLIHNLSQWPQAFEKNDVLLVDTLFMNQVLANDFKGKKILIVHHLEGFEKGALSQEEKIQLKEFDAFLVSSSFSQTFLQEEGFLKPISVIEPALHFEAQTLDKSFDSFNILLVSNIIQRKGILPFLQAFQKVFANQLSDRKIELAIVGDSSMDISYQQKVAEYISASPFLKALNPIQGHKSKEEMGSMYHHSNVFVSAASMETFGMALQEAMAFSLPLFALKAGHVTAHLDKQSSFGFENLEELCFALLEFYQKPNEHQRILSFAKKRTLESSYPTWDNKAKELKTFLLKFELL